MRKFVIGAVLAAVMLAGVALPFGGGATPAFAVKTEICHWDTGKTNVPEHSAAFRAPSWVLIEVNDNALDAHDGVHTDSGGLFDMTGLDAGQCDGRNA